MRNISLTHKILTMLLTALLMPSMAMSLSASSPKYEFRGAWIATVYGIDWPQTVGADLESARKQQQELSSMLKGLSDAGINAVLFQARPMADAFYNSSIEPTSGFLTGQRGKAATYDPLAYCVEQAHRLGMECHAWINPFRVGTKQPSTSADRRHSELWITNSVGKSTMTIFNPALPQTRRHLCRIVSEIAENYDIDGIVFDDYFYNPEFLPENESASDWDTFCASAEGLTMADWRRKNINTVIAEVYSELQSVKDGKIRFGVSPQGIAGGNGAYAHIGVASPTTYGVITADSQYSKIYSDPVNWIVNGIVDYVSPQIYWTTDNPRHPYGGLSRWWNDVAEQFGRHCFPSLTISVLAKDNSPSKWAETERQIDINREASDNHAPGSILYSAACISGPKCKGLGNHLASGRFSAKALMPPMQWKEAPTPRNTEGLTLKGNKLSWIREGDLRYVVYAIPDRTDIIDALDPDADGFASDYIVAIVYGDSFELPKSLLSNHRIAVAPYDRYGNEWEPTFLRVHGN